jgi:hypothetical protein
MRARSQPSARKHEPVDTLALLPARPTQLVRYHRIYVLGMVRVCGVVCGASS